MKYKYYIISYKKRQDKIRLSHKQVNISLNTQTHTSSSDQARDKAVQVAGSGRQPCKSAGNLNRVSSYLQERKRARESEIERERERET